MGSTLKLEVECHHCFAGSDPDSQKDNGVISSTKSAFNCALMLQLLIVWQELGKMTLTDSFRRQPPQYELSLLCAFVIILHVSTLRQDVSDAKLT